MSNPEKMSLAVASHGPEYSVYVAESYSMLWVPCVQYLSTYK